MFCGEPGGLAQRGVGGHELHLGAGQQHLAELSLSRVEDVRDDLPLILAERLVTGYQVAQFLFGHDRTVGLRVSAHDGDDEVGRLRQEPHHRPGQDGDPIQDRRGGQRHPLLPLQRDPLGR